jgi:magnesium transporter
VSRLYDIPRSALDECMAPLHLPKHHKLEGVTFLITRVFDEESAKNADGFLELTRKLSIFLGDRFLVTIHRRRLPFLEEIKGCAKRATEPQYLQVLLLEILIAGVETYYAPLERAELHVHELESNLLDRRATSRVAWREVFRTKVRVQTFKRLLWHVQNSAQKFVPRSAINEPLAEDLRERITSLSFLAESLDDDLDNLLAIQLSIAANRTNDVMRLLALFSAVFLPLTFIVGVYGMNFDVMPELHVAWAYPVLLAAMAACAGVMLWYFGRKGWLRPPGDR